MALRIEFDESLRPEGGSMVLCSSSGPIKSVNKDPAGHPFHLFQLKQAGLWVDPAAAREDDPDSSCDSPREYSRASSGLDEQAPTDVNFKSSGKKSVKKKKKKSDADMYALLGLQNERWTATEKQLKDGYRKVCLEHHPDKKCAGVTDEVEKERIEEYFKQVQEAYMILSDPAKRREFDSTDEFDDSLPSECAAADFFKVFGPAFRRNQRWSVATKTPEFGDDSTTWEEVEKFYDFWFTFKSWREFPHPDEEDVEGCEGRDHRRYVDRINSKLREKGKKEEGKRLKQFVEDAYRIDPRVVKRKEDERLERERKKQEKDFARRAVYIEADRKKAEEEAAKKVAEDADKIKKAEEKVVREAVKKATKKARQQLRALCENAGSTGRLISDDDCERLCAKLDCESLQELNESISAIGITREVQQELLAESLLLLDDKGAAEIRAKERLKKAAELALKDAADKDHAKKVSQMSEWNEEELRLLDKAVKKYPVGTHKRWDQVTAYVRTRTVEEVLLMVKENQGMIAARSNKAEDFKAGQKKRAEVTSEADLRSHAFTDVDVNLSGSAANVVENMMTPEELEAFMAAAAAPVPVAAAAPAAAAPAAAVDGEKQAPDPAAAANGEEATPAEAAPAAAAPAEAVDGEEKATASDASAAEEPAAAANGKPAAGGEKKVVSADSGEWSEEQELALVKAMKMFGKDVADRWDRVSEIVPDKSKKQCKLRFNELRDVFRAKKGDE